MAWWDDVGDAINSVTQTVGNVVESVVNAVAEVVADIVETAGNGIQDGLNFIGAILPSIGIRPRGGDGKTYSGFCAWLGGIVAGITNLAGAVIKGALGIVGGVIGGLIKIIGGLVGALFSGDWNVVLEGLIDIGSSIAGAVISILGTLGSLIQRIFFLQNNERTLTKEEMAMLRIVFKNSISLYNVRLIEGWSGMFGITTDGATTLNNTIYFNKTEVASNLDVLVHECVHVWQYQNLGNRYLMDALGAQAIYGRKPGGINDAYDWTDELDRGRTRWEDFNKEAQATLIQDIWNDGALNILDLGTAITTPKTGSGAFYEKPDPQEDFSQVFTESFISTRDNTRHTALAIATMKSLRGYWNFRPSHFINY